jgi:glutathione S-transferase
MVHHPGDRGGHRPGIGGLASQNWSLRSRATIAKWMLDECGAGYEIVPIDLQKREHKTPEFLRINPTGKIPALVDGTSRIFETCS